MAIGVSQTVADQNRLEVDVAILVREDFRGEDRNVVAGVAFTSDVKVLPGILRELLEEQRQQRIDVLTGSGGVADGAAAVRVANIDWLVKEDDGSVAVPGVRVILELDAIINRRRAELEEKTGEGRAARAAVEPEDDRVVLGIISRLEEPCNMRY